MCAEISEGDFLCHLPILEYTTFLNKNITPPHNCEIRNVHVFYPFPGNKWLFTITKHTTVSVECVNRNKISDFYLHGAGILLLKDNCKAYTATGIIMASIKYNKTYEHYTPWVNINLTETTPTLNSTYRNLQPVKITNLDPKELNILAHKVDAFEKILDLRQGQDNLRERTSWFPPLIGLSLLGIGLYWILKFYPLVTWSLASLNISRLWDRRTVRRTESLGADLPNYGSRRNYGSQSEDGMD
jgi:hypothetical protein